MSFMGLPSPKNQTCSELARAAPVGVCLKSFRHSVWSVPSARTQPELGRREAQLPSGAAVRELLMWYSRRLGGDGGADSMVAV